MRDSGEFPPVGDRSPGGGLRHQPDPEGPPRVVRRALKSIAALLVTGGSLAWVIWLLQSAWPDLVGGLHELSWRPVVVGTTLVAIGSLLMFAAFAGLVRAFRVSTTPWLSLAHMYYVSQLLKHLPGRVWGLGYQWMAAGGDGSLGGWVLVNASHMVLGLYFAVWSAWAVLVSRESPVAVVAVVIAGFAAYVIGWRLATSPLFARLLGTLPGRVGKVASSAPAIVGYASRRAQLGILALLVLGWLVHYLGWWYYGEAYSRLGGDAAVRLCACYMLAWVAGYVSIITPSGLGVRELVFVWLAKDYPGDVVAFMAVLGRVSLLSVDILLGILFAPFLPRTRTD